MDQSAKYRIHYVPSVLREVERCISSASAKGAYATLVKCYLLSSQNMSAYNLLTCRVADSVDNVDNICDTIR